VVFHEYVSIRKALRAQQGRHESRQSFAEVTLATPTMQAVQDSWKGPGMRHASVLWFAQAVLFLLVTPDSFIVYCVCLLLHCVLVCVYYCIY
jgi:hypothetical protein